MSRLRLADDVSPGDWVARGVGPFGSGVGGLLPGGFDACARILHPASTRDGMPIRWDTIGEWSGGTAHPLVKFEALARPRDGAGHADAPFDQPPRTGHLPEPVLGDLCDVLSRHTRTPERCWFCLWEGYGWIRGGALDTLGGTMRLPPAFGPATLSPPRVRLPERTYLLFAGPLDAASDMGWRLDGRLIDPQSPNLFWPDEHAWCVATEIDLDSTFVGGPAALIADVLGDVRLEAWPSQSPPTPCRHRAMRSTADPLPAGQAVDSSSWRRP